MKSFMMFFFFFQAEDGIRDGTVTGVQTCALPILINGMGDLQIDADARLPKLAANKGIALMPLLTNLVGDTWQPEAIENLAHGPGERQDRFIQSVLSVLRTAKASGVVIDWQQIDPVYKKDVTKFIDKFADALHADN